MPIGATLAATAVSAGVGLYSASQQKDAANASLQAQTAANDKALAAQQAALDRVTQLESPFQQGGSLGMAALLQRLGLTQPNGTPTGQPASDPYYGYNIQRSGSTPGTAPAQTSAVSRPGGAHPLPDGQSLPNPKAGSPMPMPGQPDAGAGVTVPGAPAATGATPSAQVPDWNAFLQANPDIAAWAAQGHGDPSKPAGSQTPQEAAAYWVSQHQQLGDDPRAMQLPMMADPNAAPSSANGNTPSSPQAPDLMNAPRPDAPVIPNYVTPDQGTAPTFGPAPSQADYFSAGAFHADPGFQFALDQGLRSANAGYAARGLLKSDAAIKGLNDYGQGMADQQYGNWFNRQNSLYGQALGQFNTDRSYGTNLFLTNRANTNQNALNQYQQNTNLALNQRDFNNNNFTNDRNYQAGRYDTATGNLFSLAQIGQNAAGAVGGASQSYANNASNIFGAQANAATNAANQRAQANAGAFGAIGGVAANLFNTLPGFTSPVSAPLTVGDAYPTVTGAVAPIMPTGAMSTFQPPVF